MGELEGFLPITLNESPSEKEGKLPALYAQNRSPPPSMKVPPKRKGNPRVVKFHAYYSRPSMKVPPKRKGNSGRSSASRHHQSPLNESPSEKEGKSHG